MSFTPEEIAAAREEMERRKREDPLWTWKPEPQQQDVLDDQRPIIYIEGDNGSGKTEVLCRRYGAMLMQWPYPDWYKDENPPTGDINGWLILKSLPKNDKLCAWFAKLLFGEPGIDDEGKAYVKPAILPPRVTSYIRHNPTIVTMIDGDRTHTLTVLTSQMSVTEFGSEAPDVILIDEPTRDDIMEELKVRLIRNKRCRIFYAGTDVNGRAAHISDLLEDDTGLVGCHKLLARKNTHLDKDRLDKVSQGLSEEARGVRLEGKGGRGRGGLVYPDVFNWPREKKHPSGRRSNWLRPEEMDRLYPDWWDWPTYLVHDPGVNNPAATLGAKRAPFGDFFCHRCVYAERPGPVISERVAEIQDGFRGDRVLDRWIDPKGACIHPVTMAALVKAKTVRDIYEDCGIDFRYGPDSQDSMGRRERALECLEWIDPDGNRPMMWFVDTGGGMEGLKKEQRRYKWTQVLNARGETWNNQFTTARKWDHAMYCMETLCVLASLGECPYIPKSPIKEEEKRLTQAQRNGREIWRLVERKMARGDKRERVRM